MAAGYRRPTALRARPDRIAEHADAFDLELDDVAGLQPAPVAELQDAAGADGARAENVARQEPGVARRVLADRAPRVLHVGRGAPRALLAVHSGDHRAGAAVELVRRDDHRAEAGREVLALGRPQPDLHLGALKITGRPVVHDGEAGDLPLRADHGGELELVVELLGAFRVRDLVVRPVHGRGIGEVEDRDLVPLRGHVEPAGRAGSPDVLLEGVEVADRGRVQDRWAQDHLREWVLGVLVRLPAAGEERLERLRGELDDAVVLDAPRPAALELVVGWREHAELHRRKR